MDDPRDRVRELSGNYVDDMITGILIGFSNTLKERDHWIDIITIREAKKEIKALIKEHVKKIQRELDDIIKDLE